MNTSSFDTEAEQDEAAFVQLIELQRGLVRIGDQMAEMCRIVSAINREFARVTEGSQALAVYFMNNKSPEARWSVGSTAKPVTQ